MDSQAFTHHFLTKSLSYLHQVLKGICEGRATILPHQVCHPITINVMEGIKKALSEQLHNLAFFTFICSSDFTNPSMTGCIPEVDLLSNDATQYTNFVITSHNHYVLHHDDMDCHHHNAWVERYLIAMRCLSVAPRIAL